MVPTFSCFELQRNPLPSRFRREPLSNKPYMQRLSRLIIMRGRNQFVTYKFVRQYKFVTYKFVRQYTGGPSHDAIR
jgi:hypothetical protein